MPDSDRPLDLAVIRDKLSQVRGKEYWRSLEELARTPEFEQLLARELPRYAGGWVEAIDRRQFLTLLGASLALAGLTGCSQAPAERIVPYVQAPEEIVPGRPLYFATAMPLSGYGSGLLVESHEGRPTKVEGNPDHPSSPLPANSPQHAKFGPADLFAQASTLSLYDPDRSQVITHLGNVSTWEAFGSALRDAVNRAGGREQVRLRVLTETVTSPTFAWQMRRLGEQLPNARWHVYEPCGGNNGRLGARHAFGQDVRPLYHFPQANVILSLDADFLSYGPDHLRHVREFSDRRRYLRNLPASAAGGRGERRMNRLYAVECCPSITGAKADHRLPLRAAQVESLARDLARRLELAVDAPAGELSHNVPDWWVQALADDLRANRGASLVIAGDGQPPIVHALAYAMNDRLGNVGRTVTYIPTPEANPVDQIASLRELVRDMNRGQVDVLLILGGNPVYTAPADVDFAQALERVRTRSHLSLYEDETSAACHWHIPEAHFLESWGDVRAADGTASIIQPLIAPLYAGRTAYEVLGLLTGSSETRGYDLVRAYWRERFQARDNGQDNQPPLRVPERYRNDFEAWWRAALHKGVIDGTAFEPRTVALQPNWQRAPGTPAASSGGELDVIFRPDPTVYDGRFANNGWLQELPKPLSKLTWDNVAYISPATSVRLGLAAEGHPERANEKVVRLEFEGRQVEAPLWVLPGHADNSVTLTLGYGRTRAGRVGSDIGYNAYKLVTADRPWFSRGGLSLTDLNRRYPLAATQHHHLMAGRDLVRSDSVDNYARLTERGGRNPRQTISLYPNQEYTGNQWGMAIDLNVCTGCSACVVACQAENNIPVVGKEQVARGREMHWLRVDTYYKSQPGTPEARSPRGAPRGLGRGDSPETYFQPVPCMHCENAPCEVVCPVEATAHSADGLNDMVYNRCVGTRYCSNNCPYKVRRFNFLQYVDFDSDSVRLGSNPDVSLRSRGVMEKCTYCVQRIRRGQIEAQLENRAIRDGEIQTACQSACPAGAIIFGDLNQRGGSRVKQMQDDPLNYGLLADLNTRPRTTYQAALKNPNPAIAQRERARQEAGHG
jgi:MoCo/4Fe-4S cofactor protein with predicted Tat translocation signal